MKSHLFKMLNKAIIIVIIINIILSFIRTILYLSISFPFFVHSFHSSISFHCFILLSHWFVYIVFILIHLFALVGCPLSHWRVQWNHETQGMGRSGLCWSASTCQVGRFELYRMGSHQLWWPQRRHKLFLINLKARVGFVLNFTFIRKPAKK